MLKIPEKTQALVRSQEEEMLEKLVRHDHAFRMLNSILNFETLFEPYRSLYSNTGTAGIEVVKGLKSLLVQFWEDFSDRQMENALQENVAIKWFCGFALLAQTPDHTYFCKLRKRIGIKGIASLFQTINDELQKQGLFGNVFTFIDASSIVTKTALWKERDRAIKDGEEKLNNVNVTRFASDKDARWGAKSKTKIWFGYKRHNAVDMRFGLIKNVCVTPANVLDFKVLGDICPKQGMVFTDKLYDCKEADAILLSQHCHAATIRKNTNKRKNNMLDFWRSRVRMPFESTFSRLRKRAKFRGKEKVLAQCMFESICYNLKKAIVVLPREMPLAA